MEQLKAMLEKAKTDKELTARLYELSQKDAASDEIIALAAEYGFVVTAEDLENHKSCGGKCSELSAEELAAVSGGVFEPGSDILPDRYDPVACHNHGRTRLECVGIIFMPWCRHYNKIDLKTSDGGFFALYHHKCAKGVFDYKGTGDGKPRD